MTSRLARQVHDDERTVAQANSDLSPQRRAPSAEFDSVTQLQSPSKPLRTCELDAIPSHEIGDYQPRGRRVITRTDSVSAPLPTRATARSVTFVAGPFTSFNGDSVPHSPLGTVNEIVIGVPPIARVPCPLIVSRMYSRWTVSRIQR